MEGNDDSTANIIHNEQLTGQSLVLPQQQMEEGQEQWMSEAALTEAGYTVVQQPLDASENPELQGAIVYQTEDGQTFILAHADQSEDGQSFILAQPDGAQDGQTYFVTQGENGEQTFILAQTDGHNGQGLILAQTEDNQNSQGLILTQTDDSQSSQGVILAQSEDSQSSQGLILAQNEDSHNLVLAQDGNRQDNNSILAQGDNEKQNLILDQTVDGQDGQTLLFQTHSNGQQIIITKSEENHNAKVRVSQNVKDKSNSYNIVLKSANEKQEVSIEQALNDLENDPEALGAFLIRKTDGKVIVSGEKEKKEEDDGNNTDELLEILGERNKETKKKVSTKVLKRKDVDDQNSTDSEQCSSQSFSAKRVKMSKSEWIKKYPTKEQSSIKNKIVFVSKKPPPQLPTVRKVDDSDATDASADEREEQAKQLATRTYKREAQVTQTTKLYEKVAQVKRPATIYEKVAQVKRPATVYEKEAQVKQPATMYEKVAQVKRPATIYEKEAQVKQPATIYEKEARVKQPATIYEKEPQVKQPATTRLAPTSAATTKTNIQVTTKVVGRPATNVSPLRTYQKGSVLRVSGIVPSLIKPEAIRTQFQRISKEPQTKAKIVTQEVKKRHPMSPEVLKERLTKEPLSTKQIKEKIERHISLPQKTQPKIINKLLEEKSQREKEQKAPFVSNILNNTPAKPQKYDSPVDILKKKLEKESEKDPTPSTAELEKMSIPVLKKLEGELEMESDDSTDDYEDELMSSDSDDGDTLFTLDIRAERAGEYLNAMGPKAEELLQQEKSRVTALMASLQNKMAALKQKWRMQSEELKNAQMTLEELEVAMTAT